MSRCYAGIGSRETPAAVRAQFELLANDLGDAGWILRSGGADGADAAFEQGLSPSHQREIYLPWPQFNGNQSRLYKPTEAAYDLARQFHPAWERCSPAARKLHARNMHQILGPDLDDPVAFVACWTRDGTGAGGTGQALRLATAQDIPVFDFGAGHHVRQALQEWLETYDNTPHSPKP